MTDFRNFKAWIPFVNRPDLLYRAAGSISELCPNLTIIDNSEKGLVSQDYAVPIIRPSVPLGVSQTVNFISRLTREAGASVCVYMHNDGYAQPGTALELLECASQYTIERRPWGVIFTLYDILFALNMDLLKRVGEWDENLPWYCADVDYYRRITLAGLECINSGLQDKVEHLSSQTIRSDPKRSFINDITYPLHREYYKRKWSGYPGEEKWDKPFDGALERL